MIKKMITPIVDDFRKFTWADFVLKGYSFNAFIGYIMSDILMAFFQTIYVFLVIFISGFAFELLIEIIKKKKANYREARWTLYGGFMSFIIHFFFG
jgi:hypothetical protein